MAKVQLCPLIPCNFAMFCGMIYITVIMVGTFYFSSIMSYQQQSYTHLQRNNSSMYLVMNRRLSFDLIDDTKEKYYYVTLSHPQSQMRKIGNSSWLIHLCYVQWLLPLFPFCDKHQKQNHSLLTVPTKLTNKMQSENSTSIEFDQKDKLTNDNQYLTRSQGKYNIIDLPFSRLVPLVYVSSAFIFGVGLIIILVFSLCVCIRSCGTDCNS
ncbi:uncharacterized protein LOC112600378 [Melanaphis sacchari]|uniref:uncharacterized protein LOC112600378 n=1 Tax=Melanaphis sacchari TaxID=742174 RepID=UPI000DC14035|nr:uncharacterized protein LOC112600378 [Melanaphis sacchari]